MTKATMLDGYLDMTLEELAKYFSLTWPRDLDTDFVKEQMEIRLVIPHSVVKVLMALAKNRNKRFEAMALSVLKEGLQNLA